MTTDHYTEIALEHASRPRNVGVIPNADGTGADRNPVCGDILILTLRIADGRIKEAKQQTTGCTGSNAAASILSELVQGITLEEAAALTPQSVLDALGGLPITKLHSAALAATALRKALAMYQTKRS